MCSHGRWIPTSSNSPVSAQEPSWTTLASMYGPHILCMDSGARLQLCMGSMAVHGAHGLAWSFCDDPSTRCTQLLQLSIRHSTDLCGVWCRLDGLGIQDQDVLHIVSQKGEFNFPVVPGDANLKVMPHDAPCHCIMLCHSVPRVLSQWPYC